MFFGVITPSLMVMDSPSNRAVVLSVPLKPDSIFVVSRATLTTEVYTLYTSEPLVHFFLSYSHAVVGKQPYSSGAGLVYR